MVLFCTSEFLQFGMVLGYQKPLQISSAWLLVDCLRKIQYGCRQTRTDDRFVMCSLLKKTSYNINMACWFRWRLRRCQVACDNHEGLKMSPCYHSSQKVWQTLAFYLSAEYITGHALFNFSKVYVGLSRKVHRCMTLCRTRRQTNRQITMFWRCLITGRQRDRDSRGYNTRTHFHVSSSFFFSSLSFQN